MSSPSKEKKHPEMEEDEVFIGNFTKQALQHIGFQTKRAGEIAYDSDGKDISCTGLYPIFVSRQEIIDNGQDPDSHPWVD